MKKQKFPKLKLVEIEWRDASPQNIGWTDIEDMKKRANVALCRSTGYIIKDTKYHVTIVQSLSAVEDGGYVQNPFSIPKDWVSQVKVLKGLK